MLKSHKIRSAYLVVNCVGLRTVWMPLVLICSSVNDLVVDARSGHWAPEEETWHHRPTSPRRSLPRLPACLADSTVRQASHPSPRPKSSWPWRRRPHPISLSLMPKTQVGWCDVIKLWWFHWCRCSVLCSVYIGWLLALYLLITFCGPVANAILWGIWFVRPLSSRNLQTWV